MNEHSTHYCLQSYRRYLAQHGTTARERSLNQTAADFERLIQDNPNYVGDCTRNGVPQRFMIARSDALYKANITAFPGEELYPGDVIEAFGEHWVCYQTRVANALQISGIIWLCNHLFRWQNHSSEIIERWGVLDPGVYSTNKTGGYEVNTTDVQYKIYLPLDEDTKWLYVDKRIATGSKYDANGKEILEVYKLTRVDMTSQAYGKGAHLLLLNIRSDDYIAETDDLTERICDYVSPDTSNGVQEDATAAQHAGPSRRSIQISGRTTIRSGGTRLYTTDLMTTPKWSITPNADGIALSLEGNAARLTVDAVDELIGTSVTIRAEDPTGEAQAADLIVEVV